MDEVELALRQLVREHVVDADLEVRPRQLAQHGRVEVGRDHRSAGRHPVAQPGRDRATAGADLEAAPAGADAERVEVADGARVERLGERREPLALRRAGVVEGVGGLVRPGHAR